MAAFDLLLFVVVTSLAVQSAKAVNYSIINNATSTIGGTRFNNEIGSNYTLQTMNATTEFIWQLFQETTPECRKNVPTVSLFIETMDGVAYTLGEREIHVSAEYIGNYSGDVKREITGVLYHEMTHVWQWFASGTAPHGLIEGIADFVRLKAGYIPSHWVQPGQGQRWDEGYDITARFLDYCDGLRNGFVAELNRKMKDSYSADFFVELLGKTVDVLWSDYKAKYVNHV